MWSIKSRELARRAAAPLLLTTITILAGTSAPLMCASNNDNHQHHHRLRKRATLQQAAGLFHADDDDTVPKTSTRRRSTQQQIGVILRRRTSVLRRWERDEDGWRELPARAWPAFQPNEAQMADLRTVALEWNCYDKKNKNDDIECQKLLFQIATTLVFYNVDPAKGLKQFMELAKQSPHSRIAVDAMVACGVILVEGLGVPADEAAGIEWLERAVEIGSSSQACYELGTLYYTGIDGVLDEDPERAFALFQRAANDNHTAALYMVADCLVEGEGVAVDVARAVPLFYQAAERGHRFARQRIREMLEQQKEEQETSAKRDG